MINILNQFILGITFIVGIILGAGITLGFYSMVLKSIYKGTEEFDERGDKK